MRFSLSPSRLICSILAATNIVDAAISTVDPTSPDSLRSVASQLAYTLVKYYTGNNTGDVPGNLPAPYYWWEAGAFFGALIDYWHYTGDASYNTITTQAMLWQVGADVNYMPVNQSKTLGNDDQGFWGMAAMQAAEVNYPNPPADQPQWLELAQAVFNTQAPRWDDSTCGGGLRWQIFTFNNGYNYKNSISNGAFFNLAARLGKYTGNQTYLDWADRTWDWMSAIGLLSDTYHFYDGTDDTINCTQINHIEWTYNTGIYMYGAAVMWNVTGDDKWKTRIEGIQSAASVFFVDNTNIMTEVACESNGKCNVDQQSFKGYLSRWMAASIKVAPFVSTWAQPRLAASAVAGVQTCNGGNDGNQCGLKWYVQGNDGFIGVGEQMAVLETVQANLYPYVNAPVTNNTGGTSKGNYLAGTTTTSTTINYDPVTTGDQAGAGILTAVVLIGLFGGSWWMAHPSQK